MAQFTATKRFARRSKTWLFKILCLAVPGVSPVASAHQQPPSPAKARANAAATSTAAALPPLDPIPTPNLSALEEAVRDQIQRTQADLQAVSQKPGVSRETLAKAYGQMGKVYHAYNLLDAAEICYQNAHTLEPSDYAWTYYLGRLYQDKGDIIKAITSLEIASQLRSDEIAVLVGLGDAYLDNGQLEPAKVIFQRVLAVDHLSAGAMTGLGKIALSKRDFTAAISYLQAALKLQPQASELHYQLAMAFRGAGDVTNALAQLREQGRGKLKEHDPLMEDLDNLRTGEAILWRRGNLAMREGRYADAIKYYRQMLTFAKNDPMPRIYLGSALATSGDLTGAIEQYQWVLRLAPDNGSAHYNLGVIFLEQKSEQEAMDQFRSALRVNPDLKQAHFHLANLLMRSGQYDQASLHYTRVIQLSPDNELALLMKSLVLYRLGRYADSEAGLEEGVAELPESSDLAIALGRLLAACPDKSLRDGPRALQIVEKLVRANRSPDLELLETEAMALASVERFGDAARLQRWMIGEVERVRRYDVAAQLKRNLALYEQGQSCSKPWEEDDPIFSPRPGKMHLLEPREDVRTVKGVSISP